MNMSDCRIKLNNGSNVRIKRAYFLDWILVYRPPKTHSWTVGGSRTPD